MFKTFPGIFLFFFQKAPCGFCRRCRLFLFSPQLFCLKGQLLNHLFCQILVFFFKLTRRRMLRGTADWTRAPLL